MHRDAIAIVRIEHARTVTRRDTYIACPDRERDTHPSEITFPSLVDSTNEWWSAPAPAVCDPSISLG